MSAPAAEALARASIQRHSKSFALASRLLPRAVRHDAQVLYAYCRRADDAVDEATPAERPGRLQALRDELDALYAGEPLDDPLLRAFQRVVQARRIPRSYPDELLAGMAMDLADTRYDSFDELLLYCYRVAGTVGLMMCHVIGVRSPRALRNAAHLGIAMQLTNIARDVFEDWQRGRLYLPDSWLAQSGAGGLHAALPGPFPAEAAPAVARTTAALLDRAGAYYASGDAGLRELSLRCAFGVRTARLVYAEIGRVVRRRGCDPLAARAVVPKQVKLWLLARAASRTLLEAPRALWRPHARLPERLLRPTRAALRLTDAGGRA